MADTTDVANTFCDFAEQLLVYLQDVFPSDNSVDGNISKFD